MSTQPDTDVPPAVREDAITFIRDNGPVTVTDVYRLMKYQHSDYINSREDIHHVIRGLALDGLIEHTSTRKWRATNKL